MKTRIFTLLIAFLATLSGAVWGQETTISIGDAAGLKAFAERVNDGETTLNAVLTNDINLDGSITNQWTPIEDFRGTFDGNGHIISGVYIDNTSGTDDNSDTFGFFGSTSGTIRNLNIKSSNINVSIGDDTGESYIGGVAGHVENSGTIIKCSFDGKINIKAKEVKTTGIYVGGICGVYENKAIESCYNAGAINASIDNVSFGAYNPGGTLALYISGICNASKGMSGTLSIENSYNIGLIDVSVNGFKHSTNVLYGLSISGIARGYKSNITSCYNTGKIKVSGSNNDCIMNIGGITGDVTSEINYCYNTGTIETTELTNTGSTAAITMYGSISGTAGTTYSNNYYLPQDGLNAVGGNESYNAKDGEIEKATEEEFIDGTVAYELRKAGGNYGQDLHSNTPAESPTLLCFTPDDAVYKLTLNYGDVNADKETEEKFVNSKYLRLPELTTEEEGKRIGWFDTNGTEYTSESEITDDISLTAKVVEQTEEPEEPTPGEGDDDDNPGGIVPDAPKYYNIYEDEICEGVTVEFSRDVVKEGQSVLVTITVDEEFDATKMTLKFKRSLFGYWEDLTLTPTENPNEYIIQNIYTDIYVRAEGAVPTGIEQIEGAQVYTRDGSLFIQTPQPEQVLVISASGAILKNERFAGLRQFDDLQRGVYIICIGNERFKVRI